MTAYHIELVELCIATKSAMGLPNGSKATDLRLLRRMSTFPLIAT